jgi:hypothetical protein
MAEPMTVWVEVWPVAVDKTDVWLISGDDAWRTRLPVMTDGEPRAEAEIVHEHGWQRHSAALSTKGQAR